MHQNSVLLSVARDLINAGYLPPLVLGDVMYCPIVSGENPDLTNELDLSYEMEDYTGVDAELWIFREEHPGYVILEHPPTERTAEDRLSLFASHER